VKMDLQTILFIIGILLVAGRHSFNFGTVNNYHGEDKEEELPEKKRRQLRARRSGED
jgi:hypothetical protein